MTVRRATADDDQLLAGLQWRWRVDEWAGDPELSQAEFEQRFIDWTVDHQATHLPFVATEDGRTVGMAWLVITDRVPTPPRWLRRGGHLQSVFVEPAMRNHGVGSALIEALLAEARALQLDYVIVHPSERSFPLYRRHGFTGTGQFLELWLRRAGGGGEADP